MVSKKTLVKLFFTFFIIYVSFAYFVGTNEDVRIYTTYSLVNEFNLDINEYTTNNGNYLIDQITLGNNTYSNKAPGSVYLTLPIGLAIKLFFDDMSLHKSLLLFSFMSIIFISIISSLSMILLYYILGYFTKKDKHKFAILTIYSLGTIIFQISRIYIPYVFANFLIMISFYLMLKSLYENKNYYFVSGLLASLSIFFEYLSIFPILIIGLFCFKKKNINLIFIFIIGIIVGLTPLVVYNHSVYGSVFETSLHTFDTGYKMINTICSYGSSNTDHFYGCKYTFTKNSSFLDKVKDKELKKVSLESEKNIDKKNYGSKKPLSFFKGTIPAFKVDPYHLIIKPELNQFLRITLYPYRGFLFYSPVLLLSFIGLFFMYKRKKFETIIISTIILLTLLVLSNHYFIPLWWGGSSFGYRYIYPIVIFLMIPLLYFIKKTSNNLILFFAILSISINIIGLSSPFENQLMIPVGDHLDISEETAIKLNSFESVGNPLFEHYFPNFLDHGPKSFLIEQVFNINILPWINVLILLIILSLIWFKEIKNFIITKPKEIIKIFFIILITFSLLFSIYLIINTDTNTSKDAPAINVSYQKISCSDCSLNFYEKDNTLIINYEIPHEKNKFQIFLHKVIEKLFKIDVDYGWVSIYKILDDESWQEKDSFNINIMSDQDVNMTIKIREIGKDFYYNLNLKKSDKFEEFNIPLTKFEKPDWISKDYKQELKNITEIAIFLTSFDEAKQGTMELKLFNGEIYNLS